MDAVSTPNLESIARRLTITIPSALIKHTSTARLVDMLDFSRTAFEKKISLTIKKKTEAQSKWPLEKLGDKVHVLIGGTPSRNIAEYFTGNNLWVSIAEMNGQIIADTKEKITDIAVQKSNVKKIPKGTTLLSFKLSIGKTAIAGSELYTNEAIAALIPKDNKELSNQYLFHLFNAKQIDLENTGYKAFGKSLNSTFLKDDIKIPIPPPNIQEKIINACQEVDSERKEAINVIEKEKEKIKAFFNEAFSKANTLFKLSDSDFFDVAIGKRVLASEINKDGIGMPVYSANVFEPLGYINRSLIEDFIVPSVLWGIDGDWMVNYLPAETSFYPTDHCGILRVKTSELHPRYLALALGKEGERVRFSRHNRASMDSIKGLSISAPSMEIQIKVVAKIESCETKIKEAQALISGMEKRKQAVMQMYL